MYIEYFYCEIIKATYVMTSINCFLITDNLEMA